MKNKFEKNENSPAFKLTSAVPYIAIIAVVAVGYFVLFHTGVGSINSAQAQVNPGRIGDAIVDTVTGAAAESEAELSEAMGELEDTGPDMGLEEGSEIAVDVPSAELEEMVEIMEELYTGEGSAYFTSREGLGGKKLIELSQAELAADLLNLSEIGGNLQYLGLALPIMTRFQAMVSPPYEIGQDKPWLVSGTRRYSPFDMITVGRPVTQPNVTGPIPPIHSPYEDEEGPDDRPEISAVQVAQALKLVGVMGEADGYFAIINAQGSESIYRAGDKMGPYMNQTYIVTEITLDAVRIVNNAFPSDTAMIQFFERDISGIREFSISN